MVMKDLKFSAATLAPELQVSVDSIRKKWPVLGPAGVPFDRHEVLNGTTWPPFLEHFRDSARASEYTRSRATELLGNPVTEAAPVPEKPENPETGTVELPVDKKPVPAPKTGKPGKLPSWKKYANKKADKQEKGTTPERGMEIRWPVIALVLAPALIWQMEHYATVVDQYSRLKATAPMVSHVFSWFFAFSVTGTAIVMTAAKGSRVYLYIFAGIETAANILYYRPESWIEWGTSVLLSGAMAFCIFSYSEILSKTFQSK